MIFSKKTSPKTKNNHPSTFNTHKAGERREHRTVHQTSEGWRSALPTILVLLAAPLFGVLLLVFVFQTYIVDGPSMQTTLENNNRVIVWKVPRTWARVTGHDYIPKRGDVIVFSEPQAANFVGGPNKQLIKRVAALPGERIKIANESLTVYNNQHPEGFNPDKTLPYGNVIGVTSGDIDITIPEGHVFVMGDNRSNSLDSRSFGPISANKIVGKMVLRFLPLNEIKRF